MKPQKESKSVVIETVTRIMIPFIQLFALYVVFHGSLGPGGGFQGGAIFASSFILYGVAFHLFQARQRIPESTVTFLSPAGVGLYAGVGLLGLLFSLGAAQYLNYGFIPFTSRFETNRALGIDLVEIGVAITVMAIMISIFFDLAGGPKEGEG
ncbi:MAG: Na(+)/H(+) antiporter subunit B [Desulfobacterota bacterium]|nr:Na(+)/H(+) antiporter subunit B [Thermodesulfobacteriota bacterium]